MREIVSPETKPLGKVIHGRLRVSILTPSSDGVQLPRSSGLPLGPYMFQSSPRPKTGCNVRQAQELPVPHSVSILTPSEDGVQRG